MMARNHLVRAAALLSCGDGSAARDAGVVRDGPGTPADATDSDADAGYGLSLPLLLNYSASSRDRVEALAREAIAGLGFAAGDERGPRSSDRMFFGRHYAAWIDETGFYGKVNGLWRLDGQPGDALDFALRDDAGRPVSFLVVGEDGDGAWPGGYKGGEHVEFPNRTPEPDDDPSCASGDWCNQYGLNEASPYTDPDIPWWSSCNGGAASWDASFQPLDSAELPDGIKLVYEGPLVKEADGDGDWDGDACHEDYLFSDGARRRVYLRVGYELHGEADYLDRTMQIRNPEGNPPFEGPMSLIGGFVITRWPDPHPEKALDRWIRPESADVFDDYHGVTLVGGAWNDHDLPPISGDEVFGWLGQAVSLSAEPGYARGRSATLSHVGESDNADVGFCLCRVHGGLEMGGGLLHGGISLPVPAGATSIEARRRLTLP